MKPITLFFTLFALLLSTVTLRAQEADSSRVQVIKVRKPEYNCSLEKLKFSSYMLVLYKRIENGDSTLSSMPLDFLKLYKVRVPTDDRRGFSKFKWKDDNGTFQVTMFGLRMAGKCAGPYITGSVWEKGREYGSFVLVPQEEYDKEWAPESESTDL